MTRKPLAIRGGSSKPWAKYSTPGDAHAVDRVLEEGVVAGDDQVACPCEHQPAGDAAAAAMDLRDGRLGNVPTIFCTCPAILLMLAGRQAFFGARLLPSNDRTTSAGARRASSKVAPRRADVVAGAEMLGVRFPVIDDLDRIVVDRAKEGVVERIGHLAVLDIADIAGG